MTTHASSAPLDSGATASCCAPAGSAPTSARKSTHAAQVELKRLVACQVVNRPPAPLLAHSSSRPSGSGAIATRETDDIGTLSQAAPGPPDSGKESRLLPATPSAVLLRYSPDSSPWTTFTRTCSPPLPVTKNSSPQLMASMHSCRLRSKGTPSVWLVPTKRSMRPSSRVTPRISIDLALRNFTIS